MASLEERGARLKHRPVTESTEHDDAQMHSGHERKRRQRGGCRREPEAP